jgi:hypothetical protein
VLKGQSSKPESPGSAGRKSLHQILSISLRDQTGRGWRPSVQQTKSHCSPTPILPTNIHTTHAALQRERILSSFLPTLSFPLISAARLFVIHSLRSLLPRIPIAISLTKAESLLTKSIFATRVFLCARGHSCLIHHLCLVGRQIIKSSGYFLENSEMAVEFSMLPQRPRKVPPAFSQSLPKSNTDATDQNRNHSIYPPTSERIGRTSFSSIKESNSGGAQSFTDTKTSSYLRHEYSLVDEDAIDDSESGSTTPLQQRRGEIVGMLNPQSTLHGLVCPCDGFKGWKSISVGGKIASRSFGDLTKLRMRWDWDTTSTKKDDSMDVDDAKEKVEAKVEDGRCPAGRSPFEMLPMELLGELIFLFGVMREKGLWRVALRFPTEWRVGRN